MKNAFDIVGEQMKIIQDSIAGDIQEEDTTVNLTDDCQKESYDQAEEYYDNLGSSFDYQITE
jgi:hypothetical protein